MTSNKLSTQINELLSSQINDLNAIIESNSAGLKAANIHLRAIEYLLTDKPTKAMSSFKSANVEYENINIIDCTPSLLKAKGDCILGGIIYSNVYENDLVMSDFRPDPTLAFVYLWLSFELSHMTLFSSLVSLSELFLFFTEGNMIMISGFIQTVPPSHFPEFFSVVCQYWRNVHVAQAMRSLGAGETRYLKELNVELSESEKEKKLFYQLEIDSANKRIKELARVIEDKYCNLMPNLKGMDYEKMLAAIQQPLSEDESVNYINLFLMMIRNMRKSSAGEKITNLFKNIPMSLDEVFKNENYYGLFTLVYADMYNKKNKKSDLEVSKELFKYAIRYNNEWKYGIAFLVAEEALVFDYTNEKIDQFIEDVNLKLFEREVGIDLSDDSLF